MRQRPLAIAGDRQGAPPRVLAPHFSLLCIAKVLRLCMGLFLRFPVCPRSGVHMNMLDSDFLIGVPAMLVQSMCQIGERPAEPGAKV